MKSKIIMSSIFVLSCLFLSGCTTKTKTDLQNNQPTPEINQETGDDSEKDLLKELNSFSNENYDSQLNQIESELK